MTTLIIHHDDCLAHDPGPRHPERRARIGAVMNGLAGLPGLERLPAPLAASGQIERVHPLAHLESLEAAEPATDLVTIDPDTFLSPGSVAAALRGSGAVCFAIDQVVAGLGSNAFCVTRPPGHHAEPQTAMGFCLFNHVAVGARHAQAHHGLARVAILDFDVHHGNGTQRVFEQDPDVLYVSSHQMPLYPGSGHMDETGVGNILNMPLQPGAGDAEFRQAWRSLGLPAVRGFEPDLVLVSAGFDAHWRDPLAQLQLQDEAYRWITAEIRSLAADLCEGRLVSVLEGGYDLEALATASRAHVEALLG